MVDVVAAAGYANGAKPAMATSRTARTGISYIFLYGRKTDQARVYEGCAIDAI